MGKVNEGLYNPDWWKPLRDESLERKQAATAAAASLANAGDTVLIVTEGTVTEPVYFELLLPLLELTQVTVKVMPSWASHPRHVVEAAASEGERQTERAERGELGIREPASFDHVWAVIDTDVAEREGIWPEIVDLAKARSVKLAYSTPCFEYWLLLHAGPTTRGDLHNGEAAKSAVRKVFGRDYSTNRETAQKALRAMVVKWPDAVRNAERVRRDHAKARTALPANPSTEVCRLVRTLNDTALPHLRRL